MTRTWRSREVVPGGSGVSEATVNGIGQAAGGSKIGPAGNRRSVAEPSCVRVTDSVAMPTIEKLRGRENYEAWALAMRMLLISEGSWPAVSRVPEDVVSEELKELALATICLCVESCIIGLIQDAEDPKEIWKKLEALFLGEGMPRNSEKLREAAWIIADTMNGVRAGDEYVDSGASCQMARPDQDFNGEKLVQHATGMANGTNLLSVEIFTEKTCTKLDDDGNQIASGEEGGHLYGMDTPGKAILWSAAKLSTKTTDSVVKEGGKRPEMALLVGTAEQPSRVEAQPDKVATDGPVARDGAADAREEAGLALPPYSSRDSRCRGKYEDAIKRFGRSEGLYVDEFVGTAYDLAENRFEGPDDRNVAAGVGLPACYDSFVEDGERSKMWVEAVRSRRLRDGMLLDHGLQWEPGGVAIPIEKELERHRC